MTKWVTAVVVILGVLGTINSELTYSPKNSIPFDCRRPGNDCASGAICDLTTGHCICDSDEEGYDCTLPYSEVTYSPKNSIPFDCRRPGNVCASGTICDPITGLCICDSDEGDHDCNFLYSEVTYSPKNSILFDCRRDLNGCASGTICDPATGMCICDSDEEGHDCTLPASAGDSPNDPDTAADVDSAEDRLEVFQRLIGDISPFPDWFQQLVQRKFRKLLVGGTKGGRSGQQGGPHRPPASFPHLRDDDLEGIQVPDWFSNFRKYLEARKHDSPKLPPSEKPPMDFADDVPEWFQSWYTKLTNSFSAKKDSRRDPGP